jgi:hypothetical protein
MERITEKNLRAVMARMESALDIGGGPVWTRDASGQNRARVGALVLQTGSRTYGHSWTIAQICNEAGGERTLIRGSTARELWDAAQSWLDGFDAARRRA